MKRLAIITTHPIQYNAPFFKMLSQSGNLTVKVYYTWGQAGAGSKYDPGFGKTIEWDIPLLDGYDYEFVENTSTAPGSDHFKGIINPGLNEKITAWRPDALLVFGWSFVSHLKCMRAFHKKIPIIFRGDSTLLDETNGVKRLIRRIFLRWVYSNVDYTLYTGVHNRNYFLRHWVSDKQLIWAPHAIDNTRFAKEAEERQCTANSWKKQLGIEDNDKVFLFAGKLENKKNPWAILHLAKQLSGRQYKFLIAGNGHLEEELKKAATDDKRIIFLDFQNQATMPVLYRMGDVFILPSVGPGETWGLAINEAMACSIPVLVSDKCGCAPDLIEEGVNGYTFDHRNIEDLRVKAEKLTNKSKPELRAMGEASWNIINRFSFEAIALAIEKCVYNKALH